MNHLLWLYIYIILYAEFHLCVACSIQWFSQNFSNFPFYVADLAMISDDTTLALKWQESVWKKPRQESLGESWNVTSRLPLNIIYLYTNATSSSSFQRVNFKDTPDLPFVLIFLQLLIVIVLVLDKMRHPLVNSICQNCAVFLLYHNRIRIVLLRFRNWVFQFKNETIVGVILLLFFSFARIMQWISAHCIIVNQRWVKTFFWEMLKENFFSTETDM